MQAKPWMCRLQGPRHEFFFHSQGLLQIPGPLRGCRSRPGRFQILWSALRWHCSPPPCAGHRPCGHRTSGAHGPVRKTETRGQDGNAAAGRHNPGSSDPSRSLPDQTAPPLLPPLNFLFQRFPGRQVIDEYEKRIRQYNYHGADPERSPWMGRRIFFHECCKFLV